MSGVERQLYLPLHPSPSIQSPRAIPSPLHLITPFCILEQIALHGLRFVHILPVKFPFTHMAELHRVSTDTDRDMLSSQSKRGLIRILSLHTRIWRFSGLQRPSEHTLDFITKFELSAAVGGILFFKFTNTATYTRPPDQWSLRATHPNIVKFHSHWPLGRINAPASP